MPGHPLADAAAIWPMSSLGNKVFDLSGNNYGMDFINSPIWSPGKFGSSILFDDGSSQYLQRTDVLGITGYPFSFACWFNSNDQSVNNTLMAFCGDAGHPIFELRLRDPADSDVIALASDASVDFATSSSQWSANTWSHACGVFINGTSRAVYLNGGSKGTNTGESEYAVLDKFIIGGRIQDGASGLYMSGKIACAFVWNRALTDSEVALLYREPFCMFPETIMPEFGIAA